MSLSKRADVKLGQVEAELAALETEYKARRKALRALVAVLKAEGTGQMTLLPEDKEEE